MSPIIKVDGLTKRFGAFTAVNGISFSVKNGEIFAFLGPNGAGKSTTIKMLITLLRPTKGGARIGSFDILTDSSAVRRIIGYVPQMVSVDGSLSAYDNLMLMARLYDLKAGERKARINEMLEFLSLEDKANVLVKTFSGGMVRKLEIGQAFVHNPLVLFLDEPTAGLDPIAKKSVWGHLVDLNKRFGTTIFFTTHNMDEAENVATRVAIINQGRISAIGTPAELEKRTGKRNATLEDVFIFFTGNKLAEEGNIKDIRDTRRTLGKRG